MTQREESAPSGQLARLVVSWLIVGVALAYGVFKAIESTLPLFGG